MHVFGHELRLEVKKQLVDSQLRKTDEDVPRLQERWRKGLKGKGMARGMTENQVDAYVKALSVLEGSAFQAAIVRRLLVALNHFEAVPDKPQGDGAADGLSHKKTRAYCCYGLSYDAAKTPAQRSKEIVRKFSLDLLRLFELERDGKTKLVHRENSKLLDIYGAVPSTAERISHISLIANWFESNTILGPLHQNVKKFKAASQCRWVSEDADVVLRGPKEFVAQYGVDEATMLWMRHGDLFDQIEQEAPTVTVTHGPSFDSKMEAAEAFVPGFEDEVRELASSLRADWQRAIAFERKIADRLPTLHRALERGRRQLKARVLTSTPGNPWQTITDSQRTGEEILTADFAGQYGPGFVRDLASGEVARFVGVCTINWKGAKKSNG